MMVNVESAFGLILGEIPFVKIRMLLSSGLDNSFAFYLIQYVAAWAAVFDVVSAR